ncbi:Putative NAD(P)H nitroreductase [Acaryochloris thomasi RCC1774]|uniref:NAD(P)H nitroreductase n=1 Tax=Acaryochloris thomasi RCC1774 TaxID=1764569 RepID=A0A2W1JAG9_9CYAN|nr:nitroreductase family protein [Acaryochloris thomasi]PZD71149.1 Putative NAD(P)H nitroreductase [Acaryochloris thomasi RCC1774]
MLNRRLFVQTAAATTSGAGVAQSYAAPDHSYEQAVSQIWRHIKPIPTDEMAIQHELVRYATLAASSHNTQCWQFKLDAQCISILPDLERRCPAVDPDDHHLYASLGCATENLLQAANAYGLQGTVEVAMANQICIQMEPTQPSVSSLFEAIPLRQSTRTDYDGQPLKNEELKQLEQVATGEGVNLILLTDQPSKEQVLEHVIEGNTAQMNDPAFVEELKAWIRFNEKEAVRKGDGLFAKSSGNPTAPHWLGSLMFDRFFTPKVENEKYTNQIRSSAGIAIFVSDENTPSHWIESGRCYQRFALQATALGIRTAFLNQPVEVATLRPPFASYLGIGDRRPDLVIRFGRGPEMPRSLRRPVEAVII